MRCCHRRCCVNPFNFMNNDSRSIEPNTKASGKANCHEKGTCSLDNIHRTNKVKEDSKKTHEEATSKSSSEQWSDSANDDDNLEEASSVPQNFDEYKQRTPDEVVNCCSKWILLVNMRAMKIWSAQELFRILHTIAVCTRDGTDPIIESSCRMLSSTILDIGSTVSRGKLCKKLSRNSISTYFSRRLATFKLTHDHDEFNPSDRSVIISSGGGAADTQDYKRTMTEYNVEKSVTFSEAADTGLSSEKNQSEIIASSSFSILCETLSSYVSNVISNVAHAYSETKLSCAPVSRERLSDVSSCSSLSTCRELSAAQLLGPMPSIPVFHCASLLCCDANSSLLVSTSGTTTTQSGAVEQDKSSEGRNAFRKQLSRRPARGSDVIWYGKTTKGGIPYITVSKPDEEKPVCIYVTRTLVFLFANDEFLSKLKSSNLSGPLPMLCGNQKCIRLSHIDENVS